jgi:pyruvate dehydrogenase E1 component
VTVAALSALVKDNVLPPGVVSEAIKKFNINPEKPDPAVS